MISPLEVEIWASEGYTNEDGALTEVGRPVELGILVNKPTTLGRTELPLDVLPFRVTEADELVATAA